MYVPLGIYIPIGIETHTMHHTGNSSKRILDAALQLFSKKGYEGTSTREICELAGITKPTLYYFFQSKEGIYRALVQEAFQEYTSLIDAGLSAGTSLREQLKKIAELMFVAACARPEMVKLLFSTVYSVNSPLVEQVQSSHESMVERVRNAVSIAVREGEISHGDMDVRMTVLNGALVEAISNYLICGNPKLTHKLAYSIIDSVIDGWSPSKKGK